ncbi:MAG TPA: zf-HC2 domain-containing protein [Myxococcales bacterium]|nr:zf-HC2 domain-containing protein [Myxococcales bacterium]
MTHAESHDLLLDLAFGELDAARAAEVEQHVAGCDECRREKAALDEARRLSSPLRELEEPSPGFDEKILAAAKAQAQLTHGGNIGQVIEVAGSVQPLGLQPSSIDARAPVSVQREPRRPRWMLRAVLGGSVAVAAALALVMSTTLQDRQAQTQAAAKSFEIKIEPAKLDKDAAAKAPADQPVPAAPPPVQQKTAESHAAAPPPPEPARKKLAKREVSEAPRGGSGGDSMVEVPMDFEGPPAQSLGAAGGASAVQSGGGTGRRAQGELAANEVARRDEKQEPPPAGEKRAIAHEVPPAAKLAPMPSSVPASVPSPPPATVSAPVALSAPRPAAKAAAAAQDPGALERRAEDARHAGNYSLAAGLYRRAAALQAEAATPNAGAAAWDLAHAVECLAAEGQFDEARKVRDELVRLYPSEDTAFYAAQRALREAPNAPPDGDAVKR